MFLTFWKLALVPLHKKAKLHGEDSQVWGVYIQSPLSQRNAADEESVEDEAHITEWECLIVKVNSNEWFKSSIFPSILDLYNDHIFVIKDNH